MEPVSYTHLDVYKRQEQYDGEIIAGESLLGGACMEVVFGRQLMDCLLYTSRCV